MNKYKKYKYFENEFACRIRLNNTGPNELSYEPAPVRYSSHLVTKRHNAFFFFFFGDQLHHRVVNWPPCKLERRRPFFWRSTSLLRDLMLMSVT